MVALATGEAVRDVVMGVFSLASGDHTWISIDAIPQFRPGEEAPIGQIMREVVELIPRSWQYPDDTCARIDWVGGYCTNDQWRSGPVFAGTRLSTGQCRRRWA